MSLVGALTPLGKVAGGKRQWLVAVSVYTLAGIITSTFVGGSLGELGRLFIPKEIETSRYAIAIAIAMIAMAREVGWISFPLPQFRRQTRDIWARIFPRIVTAGLWGLDLGLIFTTYFTFSGIWLLVIVAILSREFGFGAALFATYWLGRALSVWIAPLLMPSANATPQFLAGLNGQYKLFQRIQVFGLVWAIFILIFWLTHGISI